jgi:hypothetical protein
LLFIIAYFQLHILANRGVVLLTIRACWSSGQNVCPPALLVDVPGHRRYSIGSLVPLLDTALAGQLGCGNDNRCSVGVKLGEAFPGHHAPRLVERFEDLLFAIDHGGTGAQDQFHGDYHSIAGPLESHFG